MRPAAFLLLLALAACAGDSGSGGSAAEEASMLRPFVTESDGRWIGNAICYGPHRDGQMPGKTEPTAAQLREDLALMLPHWNLLRIYGSTGFARTLLEVIRDDGLDMKIVLGVWVAPDAPERNRRETETGIELANAFPGIVVAVAVGNETQIHWSAHRCPQEVLVEQIRAVRAGVEVPVTTADDFAYWLSPESPAVARELDFVMTHAHPMWNGRQLEESLAWVAEQVAAVSAAHPDRPVVLGETGWATSVHTEGEQAELIKGAPGEAEQMRLHDEMTAWAAAERQVVFWFEAFDEKWKGGPHPAEVEKHWGLFASDRTPKAAVADPE